MPNFLTQHHYVRISLLLALSMMAACKNTSKPPIHSLSKYVGDGPFCTVQERQDFFKQQGVEYTSKLIFSEACQDLAKVKAEAYAPYADDKEQHDQRTAKYGDLIKEGHVAAMSIRWVSAEVGYGIFAEKDFAPGDFLVEYTGEVVKSAQDTAYTFTYPPGTGNAFQAPLHKEYAVDAMHKGNVARFFNHSDAPNVEVQFVYDGEASWHILFLANKKIVSGQQLFISYGTNYWKNREKLDL